MQYGINIDFLARDIGMKKAAELISEAGFTMLDYSPRFEKDNWKDDMMENMEIFNAYGLEVHQTHAPFNRYGSYKGIHKLTLDRCAEATEIMKAKYMVVHGDEFDFENMTFSTEAAMEYNHNLFLPYVELAKKSGYKIAFETVFEDGMPWDGNPYRRFTSDARELKNLITSYNSDCAVCCWDFGHANVSFENSAADVVRDFGAIIQCTHLHDNTAFDDSHQMPMTGDINWKETIKAFRDIDYSGVMSIEYAHGSIPPVLMKDFINLSFKAAEYVWNISEK